MKVLMVHNFYQARSGECISYPTEVDLLRRFGHEVITYETRSDDLHDVSKIKLATSTIWNSKSYTEIKNLIREQNPDVVHFQNIFPTISPSAYFAAKSLNKPVVQSIRNYRLACINGNLFRDGKVCELCVGKKVPWGGIKYGCYHRGKLASGVVATMLTVHNFINTWNSKVDGFIALTNFAKRKLTQHGIQKEKIFVRPNYIVSDPLVREQEGSYALYVGSLDERKGVLELVNLWLENDFKIPLKVVGTGPLHEKLKEVVGNSSSVEIVGFKDNREIMSIMKGAQLLAFTSLLFEGFPRVLLEAMACGVPIISSDIGSMSEIITEGYNGLLYQPTDLNELKLKILTLTKDGALRTELGSNGRKEFEEKYSAEAAYANLIKIYQNVIANNQ